MKSNMLKVKIVNKSKWEQSGVCHLEASAGMDLHANVDEPLTLQPLERFVPTGIFIELPVGYDVSRSAPGSGLATKHGITIIMPLVPWTLIFEGELRVSLVNLSNEPFEIAPGERIAQMIVSRHERVEWENVDELSETERRRRGLGQHLERSRS